MFLKSIQRFNEIPNLPMAFSTELEHKKSWNCMDTQMTPNSQNNLKTEECNRKNQAPWLQTILQSYRHQKSMELAQN